MRKQAGGMSMEAGIAEIKTAGNQQRTVAAGTAHTLHTIDENDKEDNTIMKTNSRIIIGVYILVVALGVGTGYILSTKKAAISSVAPVGSMIKTDKVVGSNDATTFKDSADGVIEKGGSGGEGSHKLIRDGGPSQTAYLISSVVDLDSFVGKKVKVWGQTIAAKKVSWLMDVGKVELLSQ
jgi:hypothetical protein